MKIAMIGLGKMGGNMTERLIKGGHQVVVFDLTRRAQAAAAKGNGRDESGRRGDQAHAPRVVWVMVPPASHGRHDRGAGRPARQGGRDHRRRQLQLPRLHGAGGRSRDAGVGSSTPGPGEASGASRATASWSAEPRRRWLCASRFKALAPEDGYAHVGPAGAGHYVKMVHNGIEYGLMQAYAEGFEIMSKADEFDLDLHEIASIWRYGSVVRCWLSSWPTGAAARSGLRGHQGRRGRLGRGSLDGAGGHRPRRPGARHRHLALHRFASQEPDSLQLKMLAACATSWRSRRHAGVGRAGPEDRDPDAVVALTPVDDIPRAFSDAVRQAFAARPGPASRWCSPAARRPRTATSAGHGRRHRLERGGRVHRGRARRPPDDADANQRLIRQALLDRVGGVGPSRPCRRSARSTSAWPPTSAPCRTSVGSGDRPHPPGHGPRRAHGLAVPAPRPSRPSPACW